MVKIISSAQSQREKGEETKEKEMRKHVKESCTPTSG